MSYSSSSAVSLWINSNAPVNQDMPCLSGWAYDVSLWINSTTPANATSAAGTNTTAKGNNSTSDILTSY